MIHTVVLTVIRFMLPPATVSIETGLNSLSGRRFRKTKPKPSCQGLWGYGPLQFRYSTHLGVSKFGLLSSYIVSS